MKVYQGKQETVNTGIEITNYEYLQEKAQDGLLQLSMSLGIEVMRMMLEEDVVQYAGPKGKHNTHFPHPWCLEINSLGVAGFG